MGVASFISKSGILLDYSIDKTNHQICFKTTQEALVTLNFRDIKDITGESIIKYSLQHNHDASKV